MNPLFGKKCDNCGSDNNLDAKFCGKCGKPLAGGGGKKCGSCGADNKQDANFCKKCGLPLNAFEEVQMHGNRWARRPGDFASRLDISDLPGLLDKKLEVEIGTQALIQSPGTPQELLPPGMYTLDSIGKTISNWLNGVPKSTSVLLVDVAPAEMTIPIANRFTSVPLPLSLSMRLVIEVENASRFFLTALRGRRSIFPGRPA
ncbi:MAG: zinc ribbon domain-containing protein [Anaerolineaceae bacterium]